MIRKNIGFYMFKMSAMKETCIKSTILSSSGSARTAIWLSSVRRVVRDRETARCVIFLLERFKSGSGGE